MRDDISVPILRLPFSEEDVAFIQQGVAEVFASGNLTLGPHTRRFEEMFADFAGTRFALAVNSGTAALDLIFEGLGIRDSSVIVPTNTFLASALAPMHNGNRVIFADADPATLCLDAGDVRRRIAQDTRAVVLVHIGGVMSPAYYDLVELCREKGMYLIEDAAHAHGCAIDGRPAGSLGSAAGFSMFPTKVLTTGEGGVLTTDDGDLYAKASMLRNQGKNPALGGSISEPGHNFRMSEITALVGVRQMERSEEIIEERRRAAAFYDQALQEVRGIRPLALPTGTTSGYYKYICYLEPGVDRAAVKKTMRENYRVSLTGEVYASLCHQEPIWQGYTYCGRPRQGSDNVCVHGAACLERQEGYPGAEDASTRHICLPVYPGLTEEQLQHVTDSLERTLLDLVRG